MNPVVRQLTPDDMDAYCAIRARITNCGDGKNFSSSFKREACFDEAQFRSWLEPSYDRCTIGTFVDGKMIGVLGVLRHGSPADRTFEYETVWIEPNCRKQGLARHAYEKAQEWAEDHGYSRIIHFIRADNERALEIRKKQGAVFSHVMPGKQWSDGSVADQLCFTTDLLMANKPEQNRAILPHGLKIS